MFYYPNVLQRHTGCFSTIWLAATKGIKISRRDFLKVNVGRTCENVLDYVLVQAPPLQPGLPRPRFSLYLSSQLQYGIIIVYHRQCAILLEEIQQTIDRLVRSEKHTRIDMVEPDRQAFTLPDSLFLLEEAEGALDPFFGVMGAECNFPSPRRLSQPWQYMEAVTPRSPVAKSSRIAPKEGLTVPPDLITLKEKELVVISTAEFEGEELPEVTAKEIDMLMEQQDLIGEELEELETGRERTQKPAEAMVSIEQLKETVVEEAVWLLDEETGQPVEAWVRGDQLEITPPLVELPSTPPARCRDVESNGDSPSTEPQPVEVPRGKPGRRRQLLFIDQQVQISQDAMRAQIQDPLAQTLPLSQVSTGGLSHCRASAAALFLGPCTERMMKDKDSDVEQGGGDEVVRLDVGEERNRKHPSMKEVPRELTESGLALSEASGASWVLLEVSKEDRSQHELITPMSRWSIEEAPLAMEGIPEERVELPQGEVQEVTGESLLGQMFHYLKQYGQVSFQALLPVDASRSTAANFFSKLLELVSARKLSVFQTEPYGLIAVSPGQLLSWA